MFVRLPAEKQENGATVVVVILFPEFHLNMVWNVTALEPVRLVFMMSTYLFSFIIRLPWIDELYVGAELNVPALLRVKSVHVTPLPGYDFPLAASKASTKPEVTMLGE
jgi:hypothetical protein